MSRSTLHLILVSSEWERVFLPLTLLEHDLENLPLLPRWQLLDLEHEFFFEQLECFLEEQLRSQEQLLEQQLFFLEQDLEPPLLHLLRLDLDPNPRRPPLRRPPRRHDLDRLREQDDLWLLQCLGEQVCLEREFEQECFLEQLEWWELWWLLHLLLDFLLQLP